ncbi:hypothetical protein [Salinibacillus aidingensis]
MSILAMHYQSKYFGINQFPSFINRVSDLINQILLFIGLFMLM